MLWRSIDRSSNLLFSNVSFCHSRRGSTVDVSPSPLPPLKQRQFQHCSQPNLVSHCMRFWYSCKYSGVSRRISVTALHGRCTENKDRSTRCCFYCLKIPHAAMFRFLFCILKTNDKCIQLRLWQITEEGLSCEIFKSTKALKAWD